MANFVKVAQTDEVPAGTGKVVDVNGNLIALFNVNGTFYAIHNTCMHRGGPLGEGFLEEDVVTCPWHGWRWNVKTGANAFNEQMKVKSYPVQVEGNDVKVALE
jgi:nitrite reductase/ring-hydroxylating ferredoxin subunit